MVLITARVAKRAKVMFLQVFVILSPTGGAGRCYTKCNMGPGQNIYPPSPQDQVRTSTPPAPPNPTHPHVRLSHSTPPPHSRLGHSTPPPHLRLGHSTPPPSPPETWPLHAPQTWSLHNAPPPLPTWDLVTPPHPPSHQ